MAGPALIFRRLAVNLDWLLLKTGAGRLCMIQSAQRIEKYHYAIRHLAGAAEALTRAGREVIYLNIGDPQIYGFRPPEHIVEPVIRALRNNFTGYTHSAGLSEAREAVSPFAPRFGAPP